jgi:dephospho-CoA kinase
MLTVGLTGGIGSGKSTVARLLMRAPNLALVDADAVARAVTAEGGEAIAEICRVFGRAAISAGGSLNREWMRDKVFSDRTARSGLEAIIHPLVRRSLLAEIERGRSDASVKCTVVEIPLLVESSTWIRFFDRIVVVDCDRELQMQRVALRSGLDSETMLKILDSQASREDRRRFADVTVVNNGNDEAALMSEVSKLCKFLQL